MTKRGPAPAFIAVGIVTVVAVLRAMLIVAGTKEIQPINSSLQMRAVVIAADIGNRAAAITVNPEVIATAAGRVALGGNVLVSRSNTAVQVGDEVSISARNLTRLAHRPGALSEAALEKDNVVAVANGASVSLINRGSWSISAFLDGARANIAAAVRGQLSEPAATLLLGILFGIHGGLDTATKAALQDSGLIHIIAVSGLKVAIFMGMLGWLSRWRQWSRRRFLLVSIVVVGAYVVFTGASAAALRSALMGIAAMVFSRDGRRLLTWVSLSLCATLMLLLWPYLLTDVGFQLSFLGTAGIVALATRLARYIPGPRWWAEPVAVTLAAQLVTFPITAAVFGSISLVGPVANGLVLPLLLPLTIVVGDIGAALLVIAPVLAQIPLMLAGCLCNLIILVARSLAALPGAAIHLGNWPVIWTLSEMAGVITAAGVYVLTRRQSRSYRVMLTSAAATTALTGCLMTTTLVPQPLRITALDVSSGVAVLITTPSGKTVLLDAGGDGPHLLGALGRQLSPLQTHLDYWLINSSDRRTIGGAQELAQRYGVGELSLLADSPTGVQHVAHQLAVQGTRVSWLENRVFAIDGVWFRCMAQVTESGCSLQVHGAGGSALILPPDKPDDEDQLTAEYGASLRADVIVAAGAVQNGLRAGSSYLVIAGKASSSAAYARTYSDGDVAFVAGDSGFEPAR